MTDKKIISGLLIATIVILFGGVVLLGDTTVSGSRVSSPNAKAQTQEPTQYDWGKIPINGGNVTKTFTIKNTGIETLQLFNVKTSCHCTVANVTIDGKRSENFGMSGISNWTGEVNAGKEATLTVIFDPAFHGPQGIGPVTRYVSVETNDQRNRKITYTLTATVKK